MSGSAAPIHWASTGMAWRGNMKPESRMFGRRNRKLSCIACTWLRTSVDMRSPSARLATMKAKLSR